MAADGAAALAKARLEEGRALLLAGRTDAALTLLQDAVLAHPGHGALLLARADALHAARRLAEAAAAYDAGLALAPDDADGWYGAACARLALKQFGAALACFTRALVLAPGSGRAMAGAAQALFELGQVEQAAAMYAEAARLDPELAPLAQANLANLLPGSAASGNAEVLRLRREWARAAARGIPRAMPAPRRRGAKPRIGYVSSFFGARNWMKPVWGVINQHDRGQFDVHMISLGGLPDEGGGYTPRDEDAIYDMRAVSNTEAARIIAGIGLDVLVDLNGYSVQPRLPVLMARPARRIVGWFNMFATSGMPAYDWLVGDAAVIPLAEEKHYAERIHRVPGSYLAFNVNYAVPEVAPPPCLAAGHITFGCLGSQYKLTDDVLAAWAEILRACPGTRLFLKNGALGEESNRAHMLARLAALGIAGERVTLDGRSEHYAFLEAYRQIDIALDTFPYNGGTTTTEALWQGVPVLAFDGDRWASRTSKSLILAAGLEAWLLASRDAYVARAVALARDAGTAAMLAALRGDMRRQVMASAAYDSAGLCRALEAFYLGIS